MQTLEYRTIDKSTWGEGPWKSEPDKKQWQDQATGLPCLIVRNQFGALCGYVGVPAGHPLHGKGFSAEKTFPCEGCSEDYHHSCTPDAHLRAHGGITFSAPCVSMGLAAHARTRDGLKKAKEDAKLYQNGDSARFIKEWADVIEDHGAWRARMESVAICHVTDTDETDPVWWFGFDCGHAFDYMPGMASHLLSAGFRRVDGLERGDVYRDFPYVEAEIAELAAQLVALAN